MVFAPMINAIVKKAEHIKALTKKREEYDALVASLKEADETQRQAIMATIDELAMKDEPMLAYADKPDQDKWIGASQYSDEWCRSVDESGNLVAYFRMFWICLAGKSAGRCLHITESKKWLRLHDDPLANSQRWYCQYCQARYKAGWGVVLEIRSPCGLHFVKASIPDDYLWDVQSLHTEATINARSAQELYERVPVCPPTVCEVIAPVNADSGLYRVVSEAAYDTLPTFPWYQVFNLVGVEMPAKPPKKR